MPSLTLLNESTETLSLLSELASRLGFFPDTTLVEAPYPYPGATSYPGDSLGLSDFVIMSEGTETLTVLTEI